MRKPHRVLIADDHTLFRQGIHALLKDHSDLLVVGEAANDAELLEKCQLLQPHVVLVDAELPATDGLQAVRQIRGELPDAKVIVLSIRDDCPDLVYSAIKAGALGFVTKTSEIGELVGAIRSVANGQASIAIGSLTSLVSVLGSSDFGERDRRESPEETLTEREEEVLDLVTQGCSNREIASLLCISESTVRSHLHNILDKLHLSNRVQAATYALTSRKKQRALKPNGKAVVGKSVGPIGRSTSEAIPAGAPLIGRDRRLPVELARKVPVVIPSYQLPATLVRPRVVSEAS